MSDYPAMQEMIPHAEPMILLDRMTDWAPGAATCELKITSESPFATEDGVDTTVSIEYMAQTVAACLGYEALRGGAGVRVGVIIGCRRFNLHRATLPIGVATVCAKRVRGNDSLSHFECRVIRGTQIVADAVLTVYHAEKPPDAD